MTEKQTTAKKTTTKKAADKPTTAKQTLSFQAEVQQLLHLVTHSLYSNKEIFLRELISNASDACDKLRFEALKNAALQDDEQPLGIRIEVDRQAKTLTISDNGIGLSQEEAIANLGTIAKSGTRDFVSHLSGDQKKDAQLIGQFGVGFYSGFIVADKITVESRRAGLATHQGVRWVSAGTGDFEVEAIERTQRGTDVILHLREDQEDFLQLWNLRAIISKYSDHIALPISMRKEQWDKDKGQYVALEEWETINQASALWARAKSDISQEVYQSFYKQISSDSEEALAYTHNRVEGRSEYTQLLYIPSHAPMDLWNRERSAGVKLFVKRVFIMDEADALMPTYLRFVKGVIDSNDLPLNVSRELLQDSKDVKAIREGSTKRVLSMLEDLVSNSPEKYAKFWAEFGSVLKEGIGEDHANKERLAKLLRFSSTALEDDAQSVSLSDYVSRMKEGQDQIYVITAESWHTAKSSPQLEGLRKKGLEVLLLSDRVDEWLLAHLYEFEGHALHNITKGDVDLSQWQDEGEKKAVEKANETFKPLLERLQQTLKHKVKAVKVSQRLVDSPACLVSEEGQMSAHLARLLKKTGQMSDDSTVLPILEINTDHPLIQKLNGTTPLFDDLAHIVVDQALLAEGAQLEDPAAYVKRVNALIAS